MARISKYAFDKDVTKDDFVIGSDGTTKITRNFKLEDLTKFFAQQQEILGDKFAYTYDQVSDFADLAQGKISFDNKAISDTPFSDITEIYLNRYNLYGFDVYDFLTKVHTSYATFSMYNGTNVTSFGIYNIDSINIYQNDVIKLVVTSVASNQTITGGDLTIVAGLFTAGDKFTFKQISSQTLWDITHNLNKYPSVTIVDDGGNIVYGDMKYINENRVQITFSASTSGKAYFN